MKRFRNKSKALGMASAGSSAARAAAKSRLYDKQVRWLSAPAHCFLHLFFLPFFRFAQGPAVDPQRRRQKPREGKRCRCCRRCTLLDLPLLEVVVDVHPRRVQFQPLYCVGFWTYIYFPLGSRTSDGAGERARDDAIRAWDGYLRRVARQGDETAADARPLRLFADAGESHDRRDEDQEHRHDRVDRSRACTLPTMPPCILAECSHTLLCSVTPDQSRAGGSRGGADCRDDQGGRACTGGVDLGHEVGQKPRAREQRE